MLHYNERKRSHRTEKAAIGSARHRATESPPARRRNRPDLRALRGRHRRGARGAPKGEAVLVQCASGSRRSGGSGDALPAPRGGRAPEERLRELDRFGDARRRVTPARVPEPPHGRDRRELLVERSDRTRAGRSRCSGRRRRPRRGGAAGPRARRSSPTGSTRSRRRRLRVRRRGCWLPRARSTRNASTSLPGRQDGEQAALEQREPLVGGQQRARLAALRCKRSRPKKRAAVVEAEQPEQRRRDVDLAGERVDARPGRRSPGA